MDSLAGAILGPVCDCMSAQVGNQLEYIFSYKDNIKNLEKRRVELDEKIKQIQSETELAKNRGNAIKGHVQDWQKDATTKFEDARRFLEPDPDHTRARCSCRRPLPNLALRRRLSKEAKEMAEEIERLIREADAFVNNISFRPVVQLSFEQKDFEKFETREETLSEMMKALRNPEVRMIGLCGLGGMGKTMLVKEVARLAEEGNLFNKQILAVVSQNPDIKQIQRNIAEQLGLKFEEEDVITRAELLGERSKKEQNILIVLDDVWTKLDLFEVGIRFKDDNKEWKIILTSRSREVCEAMGADEKTTFEIKSLTDEEAANLFNKIVGDIRPEFESLATEVIGECGGLPLAIVTTASALQINKSSSFWRNALLELKRLPAENKIYGKIHRSFETSFDVLGNEAKSLLLICSAHDEDKNVSLEELTGYVMVLDLFGYVYTLKEASDRVESLVNNLKAYSLLSDGNDHRTVKVHDVIRDVAISIASELKKNPMYCLRESVRFEDCLNRENFKELYAISVPGGCGINDDQLPERLACPRLKLLMLKTIGRLEITDRFFEETKGLKALRLDVKGGKMLASSLCSLQNLQALHLRIWKREDVDIAIIGELTNLLILDLSDSEDLVALPEEIGNLSRLQVLNLRGCYGLKVIEPYVISRLVQLEELYMMCAWRQTEGLINASLVSEIKDLPKLRVLYIQIPDVSFVPENMFSHMNLERYHIQIGRYYYGFSFKESTRLLLVENPKDGSRLYEDGFQRLMKKSDELRLESIQGVSHIVNELDTSSFQDLKCLKLIVLENLESFMRMSLERPTLFNDKVVFNNLQKLAIEKCNSLQSIWALATFKSLQQLKKLCIVKCDLIEEVLVITKEAGDHEETKSKKITFPKLEYLKLRNLPKLKRFGMCQADDYYTVQFPSLSRIEITNCPELRTFIAKSIPSTSTTVEEVEERRMAQEILLSQKVVFNNLQELTIHGCKSSMYVWVLATVESPQQLKKLSIGHCDLIEPNVISRLVQLEELYMEYVGEINASLVSEIKNLRKLRVLHIRLLGASFVLEDMFNHLNLERYVIQIGPYNGFSFKESTRVLRINNPKDRSRLYEDGFQRLMKKSDELRLESIPGVSHIVNELDASSFQDLECLELIELENLESFIATSPPTRSIERPTLFNDKIVTGMSFRNLQELTISKCNNVQFMFSFVMVESLIQIKRLSVSNCEAMEQIVTKAVGEDRRLKNIPKLESLELRSLPKLKRFCEGDCIEFPSLLKLRIRNCNELRTFIPNSHESTIPTLQAVDEERELEIQQPLFNEKVATRMSFRNLQELTISKCDNVQFMFSFVMVESLIQIKRLSVSNCEAMEQIVTKAVGEDGRLMNIISFPKLESLELDHLPKLKRFCEGDCIEFPSLSRLIIRDCYELRTFISNSHESIATLLPAVEGRGLKAQHSLFNEKIVATHLTDLVVWKCHGLTSLFNSSTATSLAQLTRVLISKCDQMTQVIHVNDQMEDESAAENEIVFSQLKFLALHCLPNLKCFDSGNNKLQFPNLEKIILSEYPEMRSFSHGTTNTPNLNKLIIAGPRLQFDYLNGVFETLEEAEPIEELWEGDLNRSIKKLWDDSYALQWIFSETVDDQIFEEDTAGHDQKIQINKENASSSSSSE